MAQHTHNKHQAKIQKSILIYDFIKTVEDWGLTEDEAFDISNLKSFGEFQLWNCGIFTKVNEAVYSQLTAISKLNSVLSFYLPEQSDRRHWLRSEEGSVRGGTPIETMLAGHSSSIEEITTRAIQRFRVARRS